MKKRLYFFKEYCKNCGDRMRKIKRVSKQWKQENLIELFYCKCGLMHSADGWTLKERIKQFFDEIKFRIKLIRERILKKR